jgi:hypothetical protein
MPLRGEAYTYLPRNEFSFERFRESRAEPQGNLEVQGNTADITVNACLRALLIDLRDVD